MKLEYAVWLAERPHCGPELRLRLLDHFGTAEAVWKAKKEDYRLIEGVGKRQLDALSQKGMEHAQIILRDCAKQDIRVLSIEDEAYPLPLRDLEDAPTVLYVRGTLPDWSRTVAIGIVGTRKATPYGRGASRWLSSHLAHAGCVIVSGMALGIDGEANRGALEADGQTIAVLGCGADICYPPSHKKLMEDILKHGAVVTEYPPGTEPHKFHFPMRNRIISGLSRGVIVIEAPKKSGALITADRALDQGRDVFAVPGNINSPQSAGVNRLLREGAAELVTCAADVLAHYPEESKRLVPTRTAPPRKRTPAEEPSVPDRQPSGPSNGVALAEEEQAVLTAIAQGANCTDAIIEATELSASKVLTSLTMLEINGYIKRVGATIARTEA